LFVLFAVLLSTKMNKNGNLCEKVVISRNALSYLNQQIFRRYLLGITLIRRVDICRLLQVLPAMSAQSVREVYIQNASC
jgi:DNA-binding Xre family transcriptional regulator